MKWSLHHGDCRAVLATFADNSVDACVTDPPYELGFMGKKWDATGIAYSVELWREVLRVLKPGAHMLAFGGTRTYHRMVCAIEDAGFEVRDSIHWLYGTGFPKSLNIGDGRGTALKPGHEPIVLARKPLDGTVAENVLTYGTGELNIDGCRIHSGPSSGGATRNTALGRMNDDGWEPQTQGIDRSMSTGRWPANVILDEDAAAELDAQSGVRTSGKAPGGLKRNADKFRSVYSSFPGQQTEDDPTYGDSGGASRFFYVAKPSRAEREAGCDHLPQKSAGEATDRADGSAGLNNPRAGAGRTGGARNFHPTVKPIELMRYLCRLVTPPGGLILDPFTGSGTTGIAALREGFRFVGIEQSAEYIEIARSRIEYDDRLTIESSQITLPGLA